MSDISIPGISSRFNTETLVQDLVDAESIRLNRMQDDRTEYENERSIWRELNVSLGNLRTTNRSLFSFENPFNERNAISSNERILRAEANREASEGTTELRVIQTAEADRFLSQEIPDDFEVAQGVYRFSVGNEAVTLRFRGGSIREFSQALNERNPNVLRSSVVQNRPGSQVVIIESQLEGESNPLGFEGDAEDLALAIALVEEVNSHSFAYNAASGSGIASAESSNTAPIENGSSENSSIEDGTLLLGPGEGIIIPLNEEITDTEGLVLEYEAFLREQESNAVAYSDPVPRDPGTVSYRNIVLPNLASIHPFDDLSEREVPIVEEDRLVFVRNGEERIPLAPLADSRDYVPVQIQLSEFTEGLNAIVVHNANSHKELSLRNIEIRNPLSRGNTRPLNAISSARNALLEIEGIPVERESNSIDDLIPGVTLDLRSSSDETVELRVEPDIDLVKESLIEWVGRYNQIIRDTNILTRREQTIIDEIEYFTDEERELYNERLGIFQGDNALNTLRLRLQNYTSSSYPTQFGSEFSLLAQAGISTNASQGRGAGFNASQLRGYLEINESDLDRALQNNFLGIKDLFGSDGDGDLVTDRGIAYEVDRLLRSYTETGGIISTRTSRYDSLITRSNEDIEDYEEYLQDYEADIRRDFAVMESAINSLESSSQGIQGLNPNNNSNN